MPAPSVWLASLITSIFLAYSTLGTGWAGSVVHFKPFRAPGETSEILVGLVWAERVQHVKDPLTDLPTTQHNFTSAVAMLEELNGVTKPRKRRQVTDLSVLSTARALLITATALSALKTLALTALFYGVHTPVLRKALYFAAGTLAFSCSLLSTVAVVVWSGADVEGVMCDAVNILIDSRSRREDVNTTATCGLGSASALCMFNIALFMLEGITDLFWLRADLSGAVLPPPGDKPVPWTHTLNPLAFFGCVSPAASRERVRGLLRIRAFRLGNPALPRHLTLLTHTPSLASHLRRLPGDRSAHVPCFWMELGCSAPDPANAPEFHRDPPVEPRPAVDTE